jgi:hypothetical protein
MCYDLEICYELNICYEFKKKFHAAKFGCDSISDDMEVFRILFFSLFTYLNKLDGGRHYY